LEPHGSISVFCVHRLTASALDSFLCCGAIVTRRTPPAGCRKFVARCSDFEG
jgi:hypothetical protein